MTAGEKAVIHWAERVADNWDAMMKRPTADATRSDARDLLHLVKAVRRLDNERSKMAQDLLRARHGSTA